MYEEKLRLEIFEHDHRQQVYKAKRNELLEIETAYRYLQTQHEARHSGPQQEKKKTQLVIKENLDGQRQDFKRKIKQVKAATNDLADKNNNLAELIDVRRREGEDMKGAFDQLHYDAKKKEQDNQMLKQE